LVGQEEILVVGQEESIPQDQDFRPADDLALPETTAVPVPIFPPQDW